MGFQFFFTGAFSFLALEALQAYAIVTNMINRGGVLSRKILMTVGVSIPAILTLITAVAAFNHYPSSWS